MTQSENLNLYTQGLIYWGVMSGNSKVECLK